MLDDESTSLLPGRGDLDQATGDHPTAAGASRERARAGRRRKLKGETAERSRTRYGVRRRRRHAHQRQGKAVRDVAAAIANGVAAASSSVAAPPTGGASRRRGRISAGRSSACDHAARPRRRSRPSASGSRAQRQRGRTADELHFGEAARPPEPPSRRGRCRTRSLPRSRRSSSPCSPRSAATSWRRASPVRGNSTASRASLRSRSCRPRSAGAGARCRGRRGRPGAGRRGPAATLGVAARGPRHQRARRPRAGARWSRPGPRADGRAACQRCWSPPTSGTRIARGARTSRQAPGSARCSTGSSAIPRSARTSSSRPRPAPTSARRRGSSARCRAGTRPTTRRPCLRRGAGDDVRGARAFRVPLRGRGGPAAARAESTASSPRAGPTPCSSSATRPALPERCDRARRRRGRASRHPCSAPC